MPLYSFLANVRPLMMPFLSKDISPDIEKMMIAIMRTDEPLNLINERYNEINDLKTEVLVTPVVPEIEQFIIEPIKEAIKCYVLGLFIPCISLTGMVAELGINIKFEMKTLDERFKLNNPKQQKKLLGRKFEELSQKRRIDSAVVLDVLNEESVKSYDELRKIRNNYIHLKRNIDNSDVKKDALKCLEHAFKIVIDLFGGKIDNGILILPPQVINYLKEFLQEADNPEIEERLKNKQSQTRESDE